MPWFRIELDEDFSKKFKSRVIEKYGQLRGRMNLAFVDALERDMFVKDILTRFMEGEMDKFTPSDAFTQIILLYGPPKENKKEIEARACEG